MSENYNLFNYKAQNYTDTSKKAYQNKEYKLKGLREEFKGTKIETNAKNISYKF